MKKDLYVYGKSPDPRNWHETSNVLKTLNQPKSNKLSDTLDKIEQHLKEKK